MVEASGRLHRNCLFRRDFRRIPLTAAGRQRFRAANGRRGSA